MSCERSSIVVNLTIWLSYIPLIRSITWSWWKHIKLFNLQILFFEFRGSIELTSAKHCLRRSGDFTSTEQFGIFFTFSTDFPVPSWRSMSTSSTKHREDGQKLCATVVPSTKFCQWSYLITSLKIVDEVFGQSMKIVFFFNFIDDFR